ncbi:DUF6509 family protein [Paenibacillus harenae]|uniref:Pullulanase n=1 Tax=Paenibacillus harenae TaxID=306543 RepID=A0ABT9TZG7_PAEHA|nr:DUF6509 family protein [Paenibacillus harenae]MDQ0060043.1 hypothetical protein [Paenibacillus harenae]MDQ0112407.1 hypothetical protein [Paenibacillus harenae]
MFEVTEYSVEVMKDPFGILTGQRYEFMLDLDIDEEDELYSQEGISLRVIYVVDGEQSRIAKYEFLTRSSNSYVDFELEEDEHAWVLAYCKECLESPGQEQQKQ